MPATVLTGLSRAGATAAAVALAAGALLVAPAGPTAYAANANCGQRTQPVYLPETTTPVIEYGRDTVLRSGGFTGEGVTVALVDSGVTAANAHFASDPTALARGTTLLPATPEAAEYRDAGGQLDRLDHGTTVASLIAAREVPGSGVRGLAPRATVLPVQAFASLAFDDPRSAPLLPTPATLAAGIRYAADQGARVVAVPVALTAGSDELKAAVAYAHDKGALVVASAGDRDAKVTTDAPRYPAAYPTVVGVTALTQNGAPSPAAIRGDHVDLAAPAQHLTVALGAFGDCSVAETPGSDLATGLVAGAAALLVQRYPAAGPVEWAYRLQSSAVRPRSDQRDPVVGWGAIAPFDALTMTLDPSRPGPTLPGGSPTTVEVATAAGKPIVLPADPAAATRRTAWWLVGAVLSLSLGLVMVRTLRRASPRG